MATGPVSLRMRKDGRYGEHDFTVSPQVFCFDHAHRAFVRNRDSPDNSHLECMWWTPQHDDFARFPNNAYSDLGRCNNAAIIQIDEMGTLLKERVFQLSCGPHSGECDHLKALCASMRHTILCIRFQPYTEREMIIGVALSQRLYLETLALADYIQYRFALKLNATTTTMPPPLLHILGALTEDSHTLNRLQIAGVPAYLVVDHKDATILGASSVRTDACHSKHAIVSQDWQEGQLSRPMPILYEGIASPAMHDAMSLAPRYDSLEKYFFDLDDQFNVIPIGKQGTVCVTSRPNVRSKRKPGHIKATGTTYGCNT